MNYGSNQFGSNQFGGAGGAGGLGSNFGGTSNFSTNFPSTGLGDNKFNTNFSMDTNKFGLPPSSNIGATQNRFGATSNTGTSFQQFTQQTSTTTTKQSFTSSNLGGGALTDFKIDNKFLPPSTNFGTSGFDNNQFGASNFGMPALNTTPQQQVQQPIASQGASKSGKDKDDKDNKGLGKGKKKKKGINDCLGEKWDFLIHQCEQQQKPFSDPEFPAKNSSLAQDPQDLDNFSDVKGWKRASEIFKGQIYMFQDGIGPSDIQQRGLGDCYLLSTFAAIAEFPHRIEQLFNTKEPNQWGCYSVNICWRGVMTEVVVDDFFAVEKKGQPFSLATNGNELWVIILEKAWAKLHKCYQQIDGQLAREALHDFTGAPARTIYTNTNKEELWTRLLEGENNGYIMCAGTVGDDVGKADPMRKKGLVGGHCYALISAHMENIKGKRVRLVKLRNPWGNFEWKGAYSEDDNVWNDATASCRRRVKIEKKDDGIFIMTFEDLLQNFDAVQVCYSRDNYLYSGIKVKTSFNQGQFFKITLPQDGVYFFQVSQISIRTFDLDYQDDNQHYSNTFLIVAAKASPGNAIVCCKGQKRDLTSYKYIDKPVELEKGKYYAYVRVNWLKNATHAFGFGAYGPEQIKIKPIANTKCDKFENLLVSCYDIEKYGKSKAKYDIEAVPLQ